MSSILETFWAEKIENLDFPLTQTTIIGHFESNK